MDDCVAKSGVLSVKVQRVYGSYINCLVLRCTLTDFKRNYHALIYSNQITLRSVISNRSYHTTYRTISTGALIGNLNP